MNSAFNYINEMNQLWFQHVPNEWGVKNLGHVSKMIVPMRDKPTSFKGNIPWVRIEDFDGKYISDSKSKQYVSKEIVKKMNLKVFPKGTVMCTCSCTMGATAIVNTPLISNQTFIGIVPSEELDSEYLYYLMQASADRLQMFSQGAIQQYLSRHDFEHLKIPLPSINNQKKIVVFLNNKLEYLDGLIQNKENLIKLLEEKHQSLITEAVTKGLNQNMKMKDSGIEWVGEIPEHWESALLKRYCERITDGSHFSPEIIDEGFPYVTVKDIQKSKINVVDALKISEDNYLELSKNGCRPQRGDVLLSKDGTIGKVAVVGNEDCVVLSSLAILTPNQLINSQYFAYWLRSKVNFDQMESYLAGAALRRLTLQTINKFKIIVPPIIEQLKIIEYLDKELNGLELCISEVGIQIQKLKEYRQSLIYEAVTGKIDVREFDKVQ
ncbi:restriction endonuclease subunit S [Priestia megaterium]|uniref:restriction endonuclease subunit S n=1 Tax=Priestia megaterium TaxID=1404 RepID=UPI00366AE34C